VAAVVSTYTRVAHASIIYAETVRGPIVIDCTHVRTFCFITSGALITSLTAAFSAHAMSMYAIFDTSLIHFGYRGHICYLRAVCPRPPRSTCAYPFVIAYAVFRAQIRTLTLHSILGAIRAVPAFVAVALAEMAVAITAADLIESTDCAGFRCRFHLFLLGRIVVTCVAFPVRSAEAFAVCTYSMPAAVARTIDLDVATITLPPWITETIPVAAKSMGGTICFAVHLVAAVLTAPTEIAVTISVLAKSPDSPTDGAIVRTRVLQ